MADIEITDEAIEAQQAYDRADAEVQRLVALQPSGVAIAAGEADIPEELRDEIQQAREARLATLHVLRAERAKVAGDPVKVELALREAARGPQDAA